MLARLFCLGLSAASLCSVSHAGPDQWVEVRSQHFRVLTDSNEKEGRRLADQFERMRWVFQTLFPKANVDPAAPIIVLAAKNEKVFLSAAPASFFAKGEAKWAGYYLYTQDKNYILMRLDAENEQHPFATVYHEYTHMQFSGSAEWMPIWLNEGLAEFMQNTQFLGKDVELGQPSVDDILYLRQNRLIPLDVLFKVDASSPYYHQEQKVSVFYSEAWALTHYLMVTGREKHVPLLDNYMTLMSQHEDPVTAAEKAFGNLKQLQTALESYISSGDYKQFVLSSAAAPIDESSYKVKALTQIEADAVRADVLAEVQRDDDARALIGAVLKGDPNNEQAHETMGLLEFRAGHPEEARKWYEQAVKLDSQDYLAHYYFASLAMETPGETDDKAIEASLRAAIALNPRFAPSYDRLAVFLSTRHENLDEAHLLSLRAVTLDPGNVFYRMNCANVLLAMQRYDDAENVLKSAGKVAKSPGEVAMVGTQIELIERFRKQRAEAEAERNAKDTTGVVTLIGEEPASNGMAQQVTLVAKPPEHPTVPDTGRKHIAVGTMRGVSCSPPMVLEFRLETAAGKSLALYNNSFDKLDLSALKAIPGTVNPCADFEGKNAEVEYVDSPDKTVNGEVIAVMLKN